MGGGGCNSEDVREENARSRDRNTDRKAGRRSMKISIMVPGGHVDTTYQQWDQPDRVDSPPIPPEKEFSLSPVARTLKM